MKRRFAAGKPPGTAVSEKGSKMIRLTTRCDRTIALVVLGLLSVDGSTRAQAPAPPPAVGQVEKLTRELEKTRAELALTTKNMAEARQALAKAQADLASTQKGLLESKAAHARTLADMAQARQILTETVRAREALRQELEANKASLQQVRKELGRNQESLGATQKNLIDTQRLLTTTQAALASAQKVTAETVTSRETLRKEIAAEKVRYHALAARHDQASKAFAQAQTELGAMRTALASANKAVAETVTSREALRKEAAAEKARFDARAARYNQATKAFAQAQAELAATRTALARMKTAQNVQTQEVSAERERKSAALQLAEEKARELAAAQAQLTTVGGELATTRKDLDASRRQLSDVSLPADEGTRARFILEVPAPAARLYIDNQLYEPGSGQCMREFVTAKLVPGKRYELELRVEVPRKGETIKVARRVVFSADTANRLSFAIPQTQP